MAPLMDLLKTGFYHSKTEEAQLKQRADEKQQLGHTLRHKQSGRAKSITHQVSDAQDRSSGGGLSASYLSISFFSRVPQLLKEMTVIHHHRRIKVQRNTFRRLRM